MFREKSEIIVDINRLHYETLQFNLYHILPVEELKLFAEAETLPQIHTAAQQMLRMERNRTEPYIVNSAYEIPVIRLDESQTAEICDVEYGKYSTQLVKMVHNLFQWKPADLRNFYDEELKKKVNMTFGSIRYAIGNNLQKFGFRSGDQTWKFLVASPAELKVGKCMCVRMDAFNAKRRELSLLRTKNQLDRGINAVEWCKVISVLSSGSTPVSRIPGCKKLTIDDAVIVKDQECDVVYKNVTVVRSNGNIEYHDELKKSKTLFDGEGVLIVKRGEELPIPCAAQTRLFTSKNMLGIVIVDDIPEAIPDYQGVMRPIHSGSIILNEACIKGLKWFDSLDDWRNTAKALKVDELRICGFANKKEKTARTLSRQAMQEFFLATNKELKALGYVTAKRVASLKTVDGIIKFLQENWKDENECGNAALFFRAFPEFCANADVRQHIYETFRNKYADAMVHPEITESGYEYILEDPCAYYDIFVLGKDPNSTEHIGVFESDDTISVVDAEDGEETYCMRHPANLLNGRVLNVENHEELNVNGNVIILPYKNTVLSGYWDGDVDGDEGLRSKNHLVVTQMKRVVNFVNPPCVIFDHDKAQKGPLPAADDWRRMITKTLLDGERYNKVGMFSNLCTSILNDLRINMMPVEAAGIIEKATIPHVLTILILDFIKTGVLPTDLLVIAATIGKTYSIMPFNQRYAKHSEEKPFDDADWNTLPISDSVVDRYGTQVDKIIGGSIWNPDFSDVKYNWEAAMPGGSSANVRIIYSDFLPAEKIEEYNNLIGRPVFEKTKKYSLSFVFERLSGAVQKIAKASTEASEYDAAMREAYEYIRREVIAFMHGDANKADKSEDQLISWAASYLLRQHVAHQHEDWDPKFSARRLMTILECFGDVLAKNKEEHQNSSLLPTVIQEKTFCQECAERYASCVKKASLPSWLKIAEI